MSLENNSSLNIATIRVSLSIDSTVRIDQKAKLNKIKFNLKPNHMDFILVESRQNSSSISDGTSSVYRKGLICTVCGAPATGFNFSVITCMCCKAFFRRNALFGLQALQCRYLTDNCLINIITRRDCSYCRLNKCFQVGMKKELILTEELKRVKREKIIANRQMTMKIIRPINLLNSKKSYFQLSEMDSSFLRNIYNAYEEYCRSPIIVFEKSEYDIICHQPIKTRVKLQHYLKYVQNHETALVDFFQHLPEFKQLPEDQQSQLSTHNIKFLVRINLMETISDQCPIWAPINLLLESMFGKSLLHDTYVLLTELKYRINDSTCVRLLIIILLFSTYRTYNGQSDTLHIYKIQEKYIQLLWLYLKQRYSELIACEKLCIITRYCLHLQTIGHLAELKVQENQEKQNSLLRMTQ